MRFQSVNFAEIASQASAHAVLATLAVTALSTITNIFIFSEWGISYASVATASDVLSGGIQAFGLIGVPSLAAFSAALLCGALKHSFKFRKKIFRQQIAFKLAHLLTLIALLTFFILAGLENIAGISTELHFNDIKSVALIFYPLVFLNFFFYLMIKKDRRITLLAELFIIISMVYLVSIPAVAKMQLEIVAIMEPSGRCSDIEYVVWAGSDNIITSCSKPPYEDHFEYFIVERSGVDLRVLPGERGGLW
ncbi:hypothetical protein [Aurantiacibacter flavus]|uniref:Uncharacterized protein n=1 Tax=Aurantiacibacter flavus TaxID=3145232 RepID=A0ABV0CUA6_9SPHN